MGSAAKCGRKKPTKGRFTKVLTLRVAVRSGHDGTRQALAQLRRIIDAERHRIRGIFIFANETLDRDEAGSRDGHWRAAGVRKNLVAQAFAMVRFARLLLFLGRLHLLHLGRSVAFAAVVKQLHGVSRQHEKTQKGQKKTGAKKRHGACQ